MTKKDKLPVANIFLAFCENYRDEGKNGAEMLRDCVKFLDNRPERQNDGKTPVGLLNEFADALRD